MSATAKLFPISVHAECPAGPLSRVTARSFEMIIDEPPEDGGEDRGPRPLETLLAALASCSNVIARLIAGELGITVERLSIDVTGKLDYRGIEGSAEVTAPFPEVAFAVELVGDATPEQVDILKAELARRCPVQVLMREAGSVFSETWSIARP